jgi:hypothetical protein
MEQDSDNSFNKTTQEFNNKCTCRLEKDKNGKKKLLLCTDCSDKSYKKIQEMNNKCICRLETDENGKQKILSCIYCFVEANKRLLGQTSNQPTCKFYNIKDVY